MAIYHKMTIEEIKESFDRLVSDPTMRSLSAVLRIGQEQLDARGRLGKYKNIAFITGVTSLVAVFAAPAASRSRIAEKNLQIFQWVCVGVCVFTVIMLLRIRNELEKNLSEENELRKMILTAAQKIHVAESFSPMPLSDEQRSTLRESMKQEGYRGDLNDILDVH